MLLLSMKIYLALLWGISALFSTECMSASLAETTKMSPTTEPIKTTKQLINVHVVHNETETHSVAWQSTHKPAEASVSATPGPTVKPKVIMEEAITMDRDSSNNSTTASATMTTAPATTSNSGPRLLHTSTAVTAAAEETHIPHNATISKTSKPIEEQPHQQSPATSADIISPAVTSATTSAAPLATDAVSSPEPTSSTKPEVTSHTSSTTSPPDFTQIQVFNQNTSNSSASTESTMNSYEAGPNLFEPTSSAVTITETSANNSEPSSTSQLASVTINTMSKSKFNDTDGSSFTTEPPTISFSTDSANTITTVNSTRPPGSFIQPKRLPFPTISSTPSTTTALSDASQGSPSSEVQSCSTRGVVKQCLIIVASLAVLATIFMVSTIVLCAKLSSRKYRVKKPQQATEMMCISALLPERSYTYTRQRNPVTNGVLVMHTAGDSDEDAGDNLTLSSFLPENDRLV